MQEYCSLHLRRKSYCLFVLFVLEQLLSVRGHVLFSNNLRETHPPAVCGAQNRRPPATQATSRPIFLPSFLPSPPPYPFLDRPFIGISSLPSLWIKMSACCPRLSKFVAKIRSLLLGDVIGSCYDVIIVLIWHFTGLLCKPRVVIDWWCQEALQG